MELREIINGGARNFFVCPVCLGEWTASTIKKDRVLERERQERERACVSNGAQKLMLYIFSGKSEESTREKKKLKKRKEKSARNPRHIRSRASICPLFDFEYMFIHETKSGC